MKKLLLALVVVLSSSVFASDNWQSSDGQLQWRNGDGQLCWRDSNWTPATAAKGCDGALVAKPAKAEVKQSKVTLQAETLFDFDKSNFKPEGRVVLNNLVSQLKGVQIEVIIAVGNTDSIGSDAYNMALGQRRAEAVRAYLITGGVPANKIYTESKGKSNPVASNTTAEGRAQNRRVDVEIVGTK
jgi:OOP family OmpA-OmpF porin